MPPKAYAYWEWQLGTSYRPFDKDDSMALEAAHRQLRQQQQQQQQSASTDDSTRGSSSASSAVVQLVIAGQSYTCDVSALTQTNDDTGHERPIRRVAGAAAAANSPAKAKATAPQQAAVACALPPTAAATAAVPTAPPAPSHHYAWQWQGKHGAYVDYDPFVSAKIEAAFAQDALVFDLGPIPISAHDTAEVRVHFGYMRQENKSSGVARTIRREKRNGPPPALFSKPPIAEPFNEAFSAAGANAGAAVGGAAAASVPLPTTAAAAAAGGDGSDTQTESDGDEGEKAKPGNKRPRAPPS